MPTYEVQPGNNLQHDGEQYAAGDTVDLKEAEARSLVLDGILLPKGSGGKVGKAAKAAAEAREREEEARRERVEAENAALAARDEAIAEADQKAAEDSGGGSAPVPARGRGKERAEANG